MADDRHSDAQGRRMLGPVAVAVHSQASALDSILNAIDARGPAIFAFCNAHTVNVARRDPAFASALAGMTVFNDGIGVELGSRMIYGTGFPVNLNGTDLTPLLLAGLRRPTRVFLVGSPPGIAQRAAAVMAQRYPLAEIIGVQHGFFSAAEAPALADAIRASGAELVLVGMGNPRQELWASLWAERTGAVICCIGAFLDFTAGVVSRAPPAFQRLGLEWVYRLSLEPKRLASRYLMGNPSFLWAMVRIAIAQRLSGTAHGKTNR